RVEDLVRPGATDAGDRPLVAQERVEASGVAFEDLAEVLRVEAEGFGAEMFDLCARLLGREQPDAGAFLLGVLREDELRAARELERERRRLRALLSGLEELEAAGGHEVHEQHELAVVGGEEEPLAAAFGALEAAAFELAKRRVERLQRRDVRRARLRDREGRD